MTWTPGMTVLTTKLFGGNIKDTFASPVPFLHWEGVRLWNTEWMPILLMTWRRKKPGQPWWRHQTETFFRVTGPLCEEFTGHRWGNSPVTGEFPAQRPVTEALMFSLICALNKRSSKQPWGWWFETPSWSLWRQCNGPWWRFCCDV